MIDAFEGLSEATADQCQYGLKFKASRNGLPMRKRTRFMGQGGALVHLHQLCPGERTHAPIEGKVKVGGKSVSLSEWSGGYPLPLCQALVAGAEHFLQTEPQEVHHTAMLPEEVLMNGE